MKSQNALKPTATPTLLVTASALAVYEPDLPWLTPEVEQNPPLGYSKIRLIWRRIELTNDSMAPYFPKGCYVNVARVIAVENLVVGRVYYREWLTSPQGEGVAQMARLLSIHDTYLLVQCNSARVPSVWPLLESPHNPLREVWEVTHYVRYPLADDRGDEMHTD